MHRLLDLCLFWPDCQGLVTPDIYPFTKAVRVPPPARIRDGKVIVPGAEVRGSFAWVDKQNFCFVVVKKFQASGYNPMIQLGIVEPQDGGVPLPDLIDGKFKNVFSFFWGIRF